MTPALELMALPLCVCLLMLVVLGYAGMHVLEREIIFIDIALAQIAAVGAIVALTVFHAGHGSLTAYLCSVGAVLLTGGFYAFVQRRVRGLSLETVIGISYAVAAGAALLLVGLSPEGHDHVQHMLSGSLLWVTREDLLRCILVVMGAGGVFFTLRRRFWLLSRIREGDGSKFGKDGLLWDLAFYALLGILITTFVRIGGVLLVFSLLIMPATLSALFSKRPVVRWLISLCVGTVAIFAGSALSLVMDFSLGPSVVSCLGLILLGCGSWSLKIKTESRRR